MAGNLQTSYGANNIEITQDYSYRFNQIDVGEPVVDVSTNQTTGQVSVTCSSWKRAVMVETAGWKYIGMDYTTAKTCANAMRSALTFAVAPWEYGYYMKNNALQFGWHAGSTTPTLESDVRVQQRNGGCMYDVIISARCTTENYTKEASAISTGSRPLYSQLQHIAGWNSTVTLTGTHFDAASARNIRIVSAPTNKVSFELIGQKLITSDSSSMTGLSIDDWYRATTDQFAQVRYEGMTKTACRDLFSSLNGTNGWWLKFHPWIYTVTYNQSTQKFVLGWTEDTNTWVYQCLNDFKATQDSSGLFTAEVTLHAQQQAMTKTPNSYTPPAYPAFWSSKLPGLSNYL